MKKSRAMSDQKLVYLELAASVVTSGISRARSPRRPVPKGEYAMSMGRRKDLGILVHDHMTCLELLLSRRQSF
jgi:hypothetical protein